MPPSHLSETSRCQNWVFWSPCHQKTIASNMDLSFGNAFCFLDVGISVFSIANYVHEWPYNSVYGQTRMEIWKKPVNHIYPTSGGNWNNSDSVLMPLQRDLRKAEEDGDNKMTENSRVFDLELSDEYCRTIAGIDCAGLGIIPQRNPGETGF